MGAKEAVGGGGNEDGGRESGNGKPAGAGAAGEVRGLGLSAKERLNKFQSEELLLLGLLDGEPVDLERDGERR